MLVAFLSGMARLGELGIAGDGLVSFVSGSVAARLDNRDFMDGLSSLCAGLSPPVVIGLLKNNGGLASRLTAEYARSILSITRHLDSHGLDGAKRLKSLLGISPLVGKVPELEALFTCYLRTRGTRSRACCSVFAGRMRTSVRWRPPFDARDAR